MFKESIKMSWDNIRDNKMRSFLTTLGIMIGVMAIIALITIMNGVTTEVNKSFSDMGAGSLSVYATGTPLKRGLTDAELQELSKVNNVSGVSPTVSIRNAVSTVENGVVEPVSVEGRNEIFFQNTPKELADGRPLTVLDMESQNKVCVIDHKLSQNLFYGQNPVGQTVTLQGYTYTVVGVFAKEDAEDMNEMFASMMGMEKSKGTAIIPYKNALDLSGAANVTTMDVYLEDSLQTSATIADLKTVLNAAFNYKDDSYSIINMETILDTMETMQSMMTGLLAGIAAISLLVGGIGIMNMMLVSVTERTKEIGLRKALGAKPGQIQTQFIIESIFLSILGGFIGMVLGLIIAIIVSAAIDIPFAISGSAIALGVGFSTFVGVVFGWTPAKRASELNPIDALRTE